MRSFAYFNNLKQIKGIGPVIEGRLQAAGVRNFAELSVLSPAQVAGLIPGRSAARIAREKWIGQARNLASTKESKLPKRERPANTSKRTTADNLEIIEGICPEVVRRLNAGGIFSYAQLAELSVERLANLVPGLSAKRETYQSWLKQAHHLSSKRVTAKQRKKTTTPRGRHNSVTIELHLNEDNSVQYTRITHTRCEVKESWPGWEESRLVEFLVRHVGLNLPKREPTSEAESSSPICLYKAPVTIAAPESNPAPACPPFSEPVTPPMTLGDVPSSLDLETHFEGQLRICNLIITAIDSDVSRKSVHAGDIFNCCLVMDFSEVKISPDVRLNYTVTVWAKKLGEKSRQIVGKGQGVLVPDEKTSCAVEVTLTSQGIYHLEAIVTLTEANKTSLPQHSLIAIQRGSPLHVY
jgi:predicted flap endonuclease-1-like 5' DNA nuclease